MKKTVSILLVAICCATLFAGCSIKITDAITSATKNEDAESNVAVIRPLPETVDVENLTDCTVAVSLEKGDVSVDENGEMFMAVSVYGFECYDLVDIASLKEGDVIMRLGENVKITKLERLDSGLVRINGGEEAGGFDLASDESTVYFEVGMDDAKVYYELGKVTLPVSETFVYLDENEKQHGFGDFLTDVAGITYDFAPNNTSIVVENGAVTRMNKHILP